MFIKTYTNSSLLHFAIFVHFGLSDNKHAIDLFIFTSSTSFYDWFYSYCFSSGISICITSGYSSYFNFYASIFGLCQIQGARFQMEKGMLVFIELVGVIVFELLII